MRILLLLLIAFAITSSTLPEKKVARTIASVQMNDLNPGYIQIEKPSIYNKIYAFSDAHGMYENLLKNLIQAKVIDSQYNWIAGKSLLVVVGDSINKGPRSLDVLTFLMKLSVDAQDNGGRVINLLGNHEAELLADPLGIGFDDDFNKEINDRNLTYPEIISPMNAYGSYMRSLPAFLILGKWIFIHSGYIPEGPFEKFQEKISNVLKLEDYKNKMLIGDDSVLEQVDWWKDPEKNLNRLEAAGLYGVVFGHKRQAFGTEDQITMSEGRMIKLDTGMALDAGGNSGEVLIIENPKKLEEAKPMTDIFAAGQSNKHRALD